MAEITRKRSGELVRAAFKVLIDCADELRAKDVIERVKSSLDLTDFEKSTYPNRPDVQRFGKILRFSTIGPVKAGWLIKSKGRWTITDQGIEAYRRYTDPEKFYREAVRLYKEWKAEQDAGEVSEDTPGAASTLEEAEENAWTEIQGHMSEMPPYDFQNLVAALLRAMGYFVSWVAPPGKDGGIDILAHTDPLGTETPRIKVQVKRQQTSVSVEGLRSFMALLGDQDVGIFISAGGFTRDAESEARTQEKRRITLIGLERLFDLWVEHYLKLSEEDRQLLPLKPVHYLMPR